MLWFFLSLATAFMAATEGAVIKGFLSDLKPLELAAYPLFYSLPIFLVAVLLTPHTQLQPGFWSNLFILLPLNLLGYCLYVNGVALSPLSLSLPFLAITPAVTILTGFLFLGEEPSLYGLIGIAAIVMGSYILKIESAKPGELLQPFKAIFKERGTVLVLLAAVIFAFNAVFGKVLILHSNPVYAMCIFFLIHNTVFIAAVVLTRKVSLAALLKRPGPGILAGIVMFGHVTFHFQAIALAQAAYMIAVKRLSGLFGVIYGGLVFKEEHIGSRLAGAACMSMGAALIALLG